MQGFRIPFLLIDGIVLYGLFILDHKSKSKKIKVHSENEITKETHKKEMMAFKKATRQKHRQAFQTQIHNQGKAYASTAPRSHILQPDKMK
jgi:hypothetical protein